MKKLIFILTFLFSTCAIFAQTRITAPIVRNSSSDSLYSTHYDSLGNGGLITVYNKTSRNALPYAVRKSGMIVITNVDDSCFQLQGGISNSNWVALNLSGSSYTAGNGINIAGSVISADTSKLVTTNSTQYITGSKTFSNYVNALGVDVQVTNVAGGSTTTMSNTSSQAWYVASGSPATTTITLPDATTLNTGQIYSFNNNASGSLSIKQNGDGVLYTVPSGGYCEVILLSNSFSAGQWDVHVWMPSTASFGTSGLSVTGTINSTGLDTYSSNLGSTYTSRTKVDKNYVDSSRTLDVKYSDTASMLSPYQKSYSAVKYTDTSSMLTNYLRKSDTSNMLSPYRRTSTKITNSDLANSTISGVSLGSNLNALSNGYGVSTLSYNGSATGSVTADTTKLIPYTDTSYQYGVVTKTYLNSKSFGTGSVTSVSAGTGMNFTTITTSGSVNADTTVLSTKNNVLNQLNKFTGSSNIVTVGTLTSGAIGSGFTAIPNSALANSTISGVSLGGNLFSHTNGYGLSGSAYNGSAAQTWLVDSSKFVPYTDSNYLYGFVTKTFLNSKGYGTGSVTSVATGYGLSGGTITTTGTLIADTTALSTKNNVLNQLNKYAGTTNTTTLGTITTGVWNGTAIADSYISSASTWNGKQAAYTNLTSIGSLANATGYLKNNGSGTFSYDNSVITSSSSFYLGTTSIALNRSSGSQSLTGISIDGNAGTVTNGAYVNAANTFTQPQTITVSSSSTTAILNGTNTGTNGGASLLVQNNGTTSIGIGNYSNMLGGSYDATPTIYGSGSIRIAPSGSTQMTVTSTGFTIASFSTAGVLTNNSSGVISSSNGTGFLKMSSGSISYDNSTYLTTSSAASTYVPYSGATGTVNLNSQQLTNVGALSSTSASFIQSSDNNLLVRSTSGSPSISFDATGITSGSIKEDRSTAQMQFVHYGNTVAYFASSGSLNLNYALSGTSATFSGNVGIGTNTVNTKFVLYDGTETDLSSSQAVYNLPTQLIAGSGIRIWNGKYAASSSAYIDLYGGNKNYNQSDGFRIKDIDGGSVSAGDNRLGIITLAHNSSSVFEQTEVMSFLTNGKVGIGTTSPAYTLDVNGTGNFTGALSGTTGTFNASYQSGAPSTSIPYQFRVNNGGAISLWTSGYGYNGMWLQSIQDDGSNNLKSLYINPLGGNVSINTTTTGYALNVGGTGYFSGYLTASGGAGTSDIRLKTNIVYNPNISILDSIDFIQYNMKDNLSRLRYGNIAQQVEKYYPDLVLTNDKGTKAIMYDDLQNIEIHELHEEVKALKKMVYELQNQRLIDIANKDLNKMKKLAQ